MDFGSIWPVIVSAVPAVTLAANAIWQSFKEWRALHPKHENADDRFEREWASLDRRSNAYLDRMEKENKRLEEEGDELRADRDYGWDLARWWHGEAHRLRHELNNTRFAAGGEAVPLLPSFEAPLPRPEIKHD